MEANNRMLYDDIIKKNGCTVYYPCISKKLYMGKRKLRIII